MSACRGARARAEATARLPLASTQRSPLIYIKAFSAIHGSNTQRLVSDGTMTYTPQSTARLPGIRKATLPAYVMLALTLVGIGAALYVAQGNYTGQPLWCPIIDGCNAVVNSPYSRIFGVPMSYFGFIYYLYMFALAARLAFEPFSTSLRFRAILYAAMGVASSVYFMYLQLAFIREVCSYCILSAITSFLLLFAALWHFQVTRNRTRPLLG